MGPVERRRLLSAVVLLTGLAVTAGGCKFDGAYDLLPGSPVDEDTPRGDRGVRRTSSTSSRSPVMVDDVTVGDRHRARRLARG